MMESQVLNKDCQPLPLGFPSKDAKQGSKSLGDCKMPLNLVDLQGG